VSDEHADRILEAGLEEVLGGRYPPDLTSTILQAWESRQQAAARASCGAEDGPVSLAASVLPIAPPVHPLAEPAPPPRHGEPLVRVQPERRARRERRSRWLTLAVAASFVTVAGLLSWYAAEHFGQPAGRLIARPNRVVPNAGRAPTFRPLPDNSERPGAPGAKPGRSRQSSPPPAPPQLAATPTQAAQPGSAAPPGTAEVPLPTPQPRPKSADGEVIAFINDAVKQGWREQSVTPSPAATDEEWCDRVYQRLVGRHPSSDEWKQFQRQRDKDQSHRRALVDRLLATDEHARHWARLWTTALVGPASDESAGSEFSRDALASYLSEAVRTDRPHEQVVFELLTASSDSEAGAKDRNGAVHFLLAGVKDHAVAATDRTSRVFLGRQLVCSSCHEHPDGGLELGDFWELNAFFRQIKVGRDPSSQQVVLSDGDFAGASGAAKDAELFYRLPDGRLGMAYPEFNGQAISHSGLISDVHRRRELAKLLVASDQLHLATVNRIWSWLLGYGFTQPVDDMGPHNPPSHPELLERLASELAAHDSNTKGLIRWIVLSEPFGLSGKRMAESWLDVPESGGRPLFARYYSQERSDGDVSQMLVQAVHRRPVVEYAVPGALARRAWLRPTAQPPQIIETHPDNQWSGPAWLPRLARSKLPPEKKIEHVFLSVLARKPTPREMTAAKLVLADRLGDPSAMQEIWRTMLAGQPAAATAGPP
jgi:hypothetical protein